MKKLVATISALFIAGVAVGEDIELYISDAVKAASARPQVLIILDNSGSMSTVDTVDAPYDPDTEYPAVGGLNSLSERFIYFTKGGADNVGLPVPDSPSEARRFLDEINSCQTARDILEVNGFYTGRIREYTLKGNTGTWEEIPDNNGANIEIIDCEDDVTNEDPTNIATLPQGYPIDNEGDKKNPVYHDSDVSKSNVEWTGQLVTLYTDNYLRWHHKETVDETLMTRMEQATRSIASVIRAAPSVDFGLQVFNYNQGDATDDGNGGRVVFGIKESTLANRTSLLDIIENDISPQTWTPLCESLYEASLYFAGKTVDFGDDDISVGSDYTKNKPAMDSSVESGSKYVTPLKACNSSVNVIIISDGEPTNDNAADSSITSLTSEDSDGNSVTFSGSKYEDNYLAALAGWMHQQDLNLDLDGIQNATVFTVGFSEITEKGINILKQTAYNGTERYHSSWGGDDPGYFYASNSQELIDDLTSILEQLEPSNQSLTSASVAANNFDRTETLNSVYYAMFDPQNGPRWQGNLKKYKVKNGIQYGQGNVAALNEDTGQFADNVTSFWSTANSKDGNTVAAGGVADVLRNASSRTLYSDFGSPKSLVALTKTSAETEFGSAAALATAMGVDEAEVEDYLNWHMGLDVDDQDKDGLTSDMRYDVFGDPLHSKPLVINYGDSIRIVIGTNAGALHMFEDSDADVVKENWAFLPKEFFGNVKALRDNFSTADKVYGVDGKITSYVQDGNGDGIINGTDKVWIFFGLRRGGNAYYALDISSPNSPKLLWRIDSSSTGFSELGQSWSQPKVTYSELNVSDSTANPVVIFGGGYDTNKDAAGPGTADSSGRAIYMVNAKDGDLLWSLTPSGGDTTFSGQHSIPSSVATLDSDGNGLADRLYFGDTGGDVWRVDMKGDDPDSSSEPWTVFKLASLGGTTNATDRRFFNEPSVVRTFISETLETTVTDEKGQTKTITTQQEKPYDAVLIGSGDRSNPLGTDTQDTFFMIKDENIRSQPFSSSITPATPAPTAITISDLYDYTNNPFDKSMTTTEREALEIAVSKKSGWYFSFDSSSGEKSSSSAIVINGVAYFTSFVPPTLAAVNVCVVPGGQGWLYAIDLALGTKVYDWVDSENPDGITDGDERKVYISEQFLGSPTLIVVPEDDGDPDTADEAKGNIIVGRRIIPVGFTLKTMRTNMYISEDN